MTSAQRIAGEPVGAVVGQVHGPLHRPVDGARGRAGVERLVEVEPDVRGGRGDGAGRGDAAEGRPGALGGDARVDVSQLLGEAGADVDVGDHDVRHAGVAAGRVADAARGERDAGAVDLGRAGGDGGGVAVGVLGDLPDGGLGPHEDLEPAGGRIGHAGERDRLQVRRREGLTGGLRGGAGLGHGAAGRQASDQGQREHAGSEAVHAGDPSVWCEPASLRLVNSERVPRREVPCNFMDVGGLWHWRGVRDRSGRDQDVDGRGPVGGEVSGRVGADRERGPGLEAVPEACSRRGQRDGQG